jgi:hypothetical protein
MKSGRTTHPCVHNHRKGPHSLVCVCALSCPASHSHTHSLSRQVLCRVAEASLCMHLPHTHTHTCTHTRTHTRTHTHIHSLSRQVLCLLAEVSGQVPGVREVLSGPASTCPDLLLVGKCVVFLCVCVIFVCVSVYVDGYIPTPLSVSLHACKHLHARTQYITPCAPSPCHAFFFVSVLRTRLAHVPPHPQAWPGCALTGTCFSGTCWCRCCRPTSHSQRLRVLRC